MKMEDLPVIGKVTGAQFLDKNSEKKENCFTQGRALSFNLLEALVPTRAVRHLTYAAIAWSIWTRYKIFAAA